MQNTEAKLVYGLKLNVRFAALIYSSSRQSLYPATSQRRPSVRNCATIGRARHALSVQIHLQPSVTCDCHGADFRETHACGRIFVKNSYAKSHGKYDKSLVADIRPRTQGRETESDGLFLHMRRPFLYLLTRQVMRV